MTRTIFYPIKRILRLSHNTQNVLQNSQIITLTISTD